MELYVMLTLSFDVGFVDSVQHGIAHVFRRFMQEPAVCAIVRNTFSDFVADELCLCKPSDAPGKACFVFFWPDGARRSVNLVCSYPAVLGRARCPTR